MVSGTYGISSRDFPARPPTFGIRPGYDVGIMHLPPLLFLLFLTLKLTDVVDWSWWWITAPLWGSAVLTLLVAGVFLWLHVRAMRRITGQKLSDLRMRAQR